MKVSDKAVFSSMTVPNIAKANWELKSFCDGHGVLIGGWSREEAYPLTKTGPNGQFSRQVKFVKGVAFHLFTSIPRTYFIFELSTDKGKKTLSYSRYDTLRSAQNAWERRTAK